jgi:tetratricopeptide (TPR) repeat protein
MRTWPPYPKVLNAVARLEAEIARDPGDSYAYLNIALLWHWDQEYAKALDHYHSAIRLDPEFPYARCARASLLATCPDPRYRDGDLAVRDARAALDIAGRTRQMTTSWRRRMYREILAAALAERGEFDAAVLMLREVLPFCITRIAEEQVTACIAQFQEGRPVRTDMGLVSQGISRPRRG